MAVDDVATSTTDSTPPTIITDNMNQWNHSIRRTSVLSYTRLVQYCLVISICMPVILSILPIVNLDVCHIDRTTQAKYITWSLSAPLMILCLLCLLAMKLYAAGLHLNNRYTSNRQYERSIRWHYTGLLLLSYCHYFSAYFLCNLLKVYLSDKQCNNHSNSVSGHYLFFIYVSFTLLHQHIHQLGCMHMSLVSVSTWHKLFLSDTQTMLFSIFYICFVVLSSIILYDTYVGGYHTLRQILYGCALAFIYQQLLVDTMEFIDCMDQSTYNVQLVDDRQNESIQYNREMQHLNDNTSSNDSNGTANHIDINVSQHQCLVHTSNQPVKGTIQRILYRAALWPNKIHSNTRICGSWLAYRSWSIILLFVSISTVLNYMLLLMSSEPNIYSTADLVACVVTWAILITLHSTGRLTTVDSCVTHNSTNHISTVHNTAHTNTSSTA